MYFTFQLTLSLAFVSFIFKHSLDIMLISETHSTSCTANTSYK